MRTEESCENAFRSNGPFWHLYTPGELSEILFTCPEDFIVGINLVAVCLTLFPGIRIITFTLMNNHFHFILAGSQEEVLAFFKEYKKRLRRYLAGRARYPDMGGLIPDTYEIPDLRALRNEIVYVNRNGYVVQPDHTPYSYPWSAGVYYFNPLLEKIPRAKAADLPQTQQRSLYHSRLIPLPEHFRVCEELILPDSFCDVREGEAYYRDAHQYFHLLSRNQEAASGIAKRLSDTVFLTDEELYGVARTLAATEYGTRSLPTLPQDAKASLARKLFFDFKASPRQIRRLLRLDREIIASMFPTRPRRHNSLR